jgi:hypothetical protein
VAQDLPPRGLAQYKPLTGANRIIYDINPPMVGTRLTTITLPTICETPCPHHGRVVLMLHPPEGLDYFRLDKREFLKFDHLFPLHRFLEQNSLIIQTWVGFQMRPSKFSATNKTPLVRYYLTWGNPGHTLLCSV